MTQNWLEANALALYGAIVGTIALLINFSRLWLTVTRAQRKLKVSAEQHSNAQENLNPKVGEDFYNEHTILGPLYTVTVVNPGHVAIHLEDAGLVTKPSLFRRERWHAYTHKGQYLSRIEATDGFELKPGGKMSFNLWLRREDSLPVVVGAYAVDQEGNVWLGKCKRGKKLSEPEIRA